MKEFVQNILATPFEFIFNAILIIQWALFMQQTLTQKFSKGVTILLSLLVSIISPVVALQIPDHSLPRLLFTPTLMVVFGFTCYKSRPLRTVFCSFFPTLAMLLAEMLNMLVYPEVF